MENTIGSAATSPEHKFQGFSVSTSGACNLTFTPPTSTTSEKKSDIIWEALKKVEIGEVLGGILSFRGTM